MQENHAQLSASFARLKHIITSQGLNTIKMTKVGVLSVNHSEGVAIRPITKEQALEARLVGDLLA